MGFVNPILGGGGALVRPAIKSPNYSPGLTGWTIKRDGSAEFNNVVIRGGTVVSGLALYYNGTPAAGNLIMSISAAAGVDTFGNAYVKGIGAYGSAGQIVAKDAAGDTAILAGTIPTSGTLAAMPGLAMQPAFNAGDPATIGALDPGTHSNFALLLTSPSPVTGGIPGTDYSQINMLGPDSGPCSISLDAQLINLPGSVLNASTGMFSSYGFDTFNTYTPTVGNAGTATYTTRTGWWMRVGKMIFVCAYVVVNAAGSGAGLVSITTPTSPSRATRQVLHAHGGGLGGPGSGEYSALCFTTGAGTVVDRITRGGVDLTGANLSAGASLTIEGWYREA